MKKWFKILTFILLLTILLIAVFPASAKTIQTEFKGESSLVALIDPGVETFPHGNVRVHGLTLLYFDKMSDPRLSGFDTIVVNYNMRTAEPPVFIKGPMHGTLHIENAGGYWDGKWTGVRNKHGFAYLRGTAHGHGGYEGLKAHYILTRRNPDPNAPFSVTGTIIDPQGE